MASVANSHLEKARSLAATVPAAAKPVLLPAVIQFVLLPACRCLVQLVHSRIFDFPWHIINK